MKHSILIFSIIAILFATSCKVEQQKEQYTAIGILYSTPNGLAVSSDEGNEILLTTNFGTGYIPGDRVIIQFKLADGTKPEGIDYLAEVVDIQKISVEPIVELTQSVRDTIGNDPIHINSMWVSKDFINVDFSILGGYKTHWIYLGRTEGAIPTDTINLEIRHNANDETGTNNYFGFISFNLSSLQNDVVDSVVLHVKAQEYNDRIYDKYFKYKY